MSLCVTPAHQCLASPELGLSCSAVDASAYPAVTLDCSQLSVQGRDVHSQHKFEAVLQRSSCCVSSQCIGRCVEAGSVL